MHKSLIAAVTCAGIIGMSSVTPVVGQSSMPAGSLDWGSSSSSNRGDGGKISDGVNTTQVGDILGPGISDHVGVLTGDLGIMLPVGANGEFAIIFGDSFRGAKFGEGEWMSPVGVVATKDADGKIVIKRPLNEGDRVQQLLDYKHNDRNRTLIPSDVIDIDGVLYMQGMWNEGIGNVLFTQIWKSHDQGKTWQSVATTPANHLGGSGNLITWEKGADGFIYVMSTKFNRADKVYLSRFRPENIVDRNTWEHFNPATGGWQTRTKFPVINKQMKAGEMSLRFIDGHWVLCMFNEETAAIEVRISDRIDRNWDEITPAKVVVAGNGGWGAAQGPDNFTQLYGGYIAPNSTIANMDIVVSQWNTKNNSRYMSTQFNVKGLDKFFGIGGSQAEPRTMLRSVPVIEEGNQEVIHVEQREVDPAVAQQLEVERSAEAAAQIHVVPMG